LRQCCAKQRLGDRLIGVLINDIPAEQLQSLTLVYARFGTAGYPGAGHAAENGLLRSVRVEELVHQLKRGSLPPRSLGFDGRKPGDGAMNVNAAMKYFRKRRNMAVVGGAIAEIQLAALESSTQCLILTDNCLFLSSPKPKS